jgi:hypothetical protein
MLDEMNRTSLRDPSHGEPDQNEESLGTDFLAMTYWLILKRQVRIMNTDKMK